MSRGLDTASSADFSPGGVHLVGRIVDIEIRVSNVHRACWAFLAAVNGLFLSLKQKKAACELVASWSRGFPRRITHHDDDDDDFSKNLKL